ncbi:hypothetical protein [Gordonia sp. NPDC058843]|uniref:hypothetical protein n=1 Tax=Gordonia sp. NPDC058843 TaxID=3346648 RepID=UPI00369BB1ED
MSTEIASTRIVTRGMTAYFMVVLALTGMTLMLALLVVPPMLEEPVHKGQHCAAVLAFGDQSDAVDNLCVRKRDERVGWAVLLAIPVSALAGGAIGVGVAGSRRARPTAD